MGGIYVKLNKMLCFGIIFSVQHDENDGKTMICKKEAIMYEHCGQYNDVKEWKVSIRMKIYDGARNFMI